MLGTARERSDAGVSLLRAFPPQLEDWEDLRLLGELDPGVVEFIKASLTRLCKEFAISAMFLCLACFRIAPETLSGSDGGLVVDDVALLFRLRSTELPGWREIGDSSDRGMGEVGSVFIIIWSLVVS